ncbi:MAG: iron-only hydrogenase system regulator [Clostridiales bacterium]|mgnify:CR=1 FL=1|nr:iron-only hydrogenase system regulator [Clostridiales bacterium]
MKKIAVISAILEEPELVQHKFNDVVSSFQGIVKGRMGIPFDQERIAIISLTVIGSLDEINNLTGKLGNIEHVIVKTAISKKEI